MSKEDVKRLANVLIQDLSLAIESRSALKEAVEQLPHNELVELNTSLEYENDELNRLLEALNTK